ncbi:uncharacterized protein LOC144121407 [Amblyomma americanum]
MQAVNMIRACLVLALATSAFAGYVGYPAAYSYAAPALAVYDAPVAAVSTIAHAPVIATVASAPALSYGYGYPDLGYGFGSYGLGYGYGFDSLGYSTLLKK